MVNRVACPRIRPKLFLLTVKKFLYLVLVAGILLVVLCRATIWNSGEADWSRNGKFDSNYQLESRNPFKNYRPCPAMPVYRIKCLAGNLGIDNIPSGEGILSMI